MNNKAAGFLSAYGKGIEHSMQAMSSMQSHESINVTGQEAIPSIFLAIGVVYIDYADQGEQSDAVNFICDIYFYFDNSIRSAINGISLSQKILMIKNARHALCSINQGSIIKLKSSIVSAVNVLQSFDQAFTQTTAETFGLSIKRYVKLLTSISSTTPEKDAYFNNLIEDCLLASPDEVIMQVTSDLPLNAGGKPSEGSTEGVESLSLDNLLSEVDLLIGLEGIKREVRDNVNLLRLQQQRRMVGLPSIVLSNHLVFYGNPGTGKTTIARLLAKIFNSLGILSKGHLCEVDRSALVGGYLGQTALRTKAVLEGAKGGVLFIDEAYSLSPSGGADQYGQEAISILLKFMEDNRSDLVVIVAGYEQEMRQFINSNPGLKSRFTRYFDFPDYAASELCRIFEKQASESCYVLTSQFSARLKEVCNALVQEKQLGFGNGRTIRNLFERCIVNQANRLAVAGDLLPVQLSELCELDISVSDLRDIM